MPNVYVMSSYSVPWVEKYRPTCFDDIVLSPMNRRIMLNIVETGRFPNTLFYGPPGTGKTTAIINLINSFQERHGQKSSTLVIHLNASDERGIEVIRNQINTFVTSKALFVEGVKFVVLDEVDYMTKNAQQALRYLLQQHPTGVRFCLICNYASKIDEALQGDLVKLRFNQLPHKEVCSFLRRIVREERLEMNDADIASVCRAMGSDVRSMINHLQANAGSVQRISVVKDSVWENITSRLGDASCTPQLLREDLFAAMTLHGLDARSLMSSCVAYLVGVRHSAITTDLLVRLSDCVHHVDPLPIVIVSLFAETLVLHWRDTVHLQTTLKT
jgi:DNA polymerase III delta prime subunit